jgi:hypothetical protein
LGVSRVRAEVSVEVREKRQTQILLKGTELIPKAGGIQIGLIRRLPSF